MRKKKHLVQWQVIANPYSPLNGMDYPQVIEALKEDGMLLHCVPFEKRNETLCQVAFKQTIHSTLFIPQEHITKDMVSILLKEDTRPLACVPEYLLGQVSNRVH